MKTTVEEETDAQALEVTVWHLSQPPPPRVLAVCLYKAQNFVLLGLHLQNQVTNVSHRIAKMVTKCIELDFPRRITHTLVCSDTNGKDTGRTNPGHEH